MKKTLLLILCAMLLSINNTKAQRVKNFSFKQKIKWIFKPKSFFDADKPIFVPNGGSKTVSLLNQGRAKKETKFIDNHKVQMALDKQYADLEEIVTITKNSGMNDDLGDAIAELNDELDILQNKIEKLETADLDELELNKQRLEILTEMNDLKKRLTDPLNILAVKSKDLNTIKADFSFKTGSSDLTKSGKLQVNKILEAIYYDIDQWFYYLDDHNEAVFKDDKFVVRIVIRGYTDKQGYSTAKNDYDRKQLNLKLSNERAYAVRTEIYDMLNKKYRDLDISLSIDYTGMGEDLPQGVYEGPEDDPLRRVCTVGTLVGPKSLIKVK